MDAVKSWLLDILIKKGGPSAIRGALLGLGAFIAAKSGILGNFGVVYDGAHQIVTIDLNTLNLALVALLPALGAGIIKIMNYHAAAGVSAVMPSAAPSKTPQEPKP